LRIDVRRNLSAVFVPALILAVELELVKPWPLFGDAANYFAMAQNPFAFMTSHNYTGSVWGFRILTPLIVYVLPLSTDDGFRLVTFVSLYFSAVVLYLFLIRGLKLSHTMAILGEVLFLTDIVIIYNVANFRLVDPLAYLFLILGTYFVYRRSDLLFALTMAVGIFNRELQLLLVPLYYALNARRKIDFRCLLRAILWSAPAIICVIALDMVISGRIEAVYYVRGASMLVRLVTKWVNVKSIGLLVLSWSLLWPLALAGYMRYCPDTRVRRLLFLMPFVFGLAVFADVSRMLAYGFPAIIPFSLFTLSAWSKRRKGVALSILIVSGQIALQVALAAVVLPK